jgi:hypothetical protein
MSLKLFTCQGGHIILPSSVLVSRQDGGNLWVIPPVRQAGFKDMQISVEEKDFVYADEEQYWSSLWSAGFRRQLEKMTPDLLEQARSEVFQKLQTFKKPDGFHKLNRALFAFGTKPA